MSFAELSPTPPVVSLSLPPSAVKAGSGVLTPEPLCGAVARSMFPQSSLFAAYAPLARSKRLQMVALLTPSIISFWATSEQATGGGDFQAFQALFRTRTVDLSLPSSNWAGTAGTAGKPRARKPRNERESREDE